MAKSSSFFGLRRGSTKSQTFQVLDGKQITKDRVLAPRNPRTSRQNAQRIIFATVASAAKVLKPLINHSFEGIAYGSKSINYFRRLNLNKLRALAAIDYAEAPKGVDASVFMTTHGIRSIIPNRYIVSRGSLPALAPTIAKREVTPIQGQLALAVPGTYISQSGTGGISIPVTVNDGAAYINCGALVRAVYGFTQAQEQLSLVTILGISPEYQYTYNNEALIGWQIPYTSYNVMRLAVANTFDFGRQFRVGTINGNVFTPAEELLQEIANLLAYDIADTNLSTQALCDFLNNLFTRTADITVNQNNDTGEWSFDMEGGEDMSSTHSLNNLYQMPNGGYSVLAAGIIRSQRQGSNWLRSTCELTMATPSEGAWNNLGLDWNTAGLAWVEGGSEVATDDDYLNEGGNDNQLGEDF